MAALDRDHLLGGNASDEEEFFDGAYTGRLSMASILSDESGPPPLNEIGSEGGGGGTGRLSIASSVLSDDSEDAGPPPLNGLHGGNNTHVPPGPPPTSISASMLHPIIHEDDGGGGSGAGAGALTTGGGGVLRASRLAETTRSNGSHVSVSSQRFEARAAGATKELAAFGAMLNDRYDAGLTALHSFVQQNIKNCTHDFCLVVGVTTPLRYCACFRTGPSTASTATTYTL